MKRYLPIIMAALLMATCIQGSYSANTDSEPKAQTAKVQTKQTAIFHVEIVCDNCVKNIQKNIGFEKGLRDLRIDKKNQTVTIIFNPQKTSVEHLSRVFEKIGKPVQKVEIIE